MLLSIIYCFEESKLLSDVVYIECTCQKADEIMIMVSIFYIENRDIVSNPSTQIHDMARCSSLNLREF